MTLIGKVLANRYEIIEEVGSGGMAVVYKAKCRLLNRFVAIKVLRPDLQNDEEFVRRFNVEAQAAASLTHPNIVSIYDVGNEDGLHYIVMEYIEGITLKEYIDEKHILPWREAAGYAIQIAKGLEQAHKNAIIHRDVKPHNIIMNNDGVLKVTDFGIARANVQATMTCEDSAIGSVHYISPEQARGGYTDERSDIYSLGVVLYEMLTGVVPFDSDRPVSVAIMHLQDKPIPPREHNLSIPLALEKIVLKAMTKEVSGRYKEIGEMISELEQVINDPSRVVTEEEDDVPPISLNDGHTIKMPAVKPEQIEKSESKKKEDKVDTPKEPPKQKEVLNVDKKKEKKVIAIAVVCAVLIIGIISAAFLSISGLGGMLAGNKTVEIPDLDGLLYDEAIEKYVDIDNEDAEYKFNIIKGKTVESKLEEGTILSQDPEAGSKVKKKEVIVITVELSGGSSEIILKDYTRYKDSREVELEMEDLGLKAEFEEEFSDTIPTGSIIRQEPSSGNSLKKGDKVVFYVSKGPEEGEKSDDKTDDKSDDKKNETTSNNNNDNNNDEPTETKPEVQKKSTMLTVYGPKDKESALVQVSVNGKNAWSKNLKKGESDLVKLESTSSSVTVEIFYDGVSQQKGTVNLH